MGSYRPQNLLTGRVTLSEQDIESQSLEEVADRSRKPALPPSSKQLLALAQRLYSSRERRRNYISPELFGEPAWDMLLALFCANAACHRLSVTSLCLASGAPQTTALRWIDSLHERGLTRRVKNPLDARVVFIELEPEGKARMLAYLEDVWSEFFGD